MRRLFEILARDGSIIMAAGAVTGAVLVFAPKGCAAVLKGIQIWLG